MGGEGVSRLKFSDGMEIDTSGEYRIIRERDGLYVVGHGILCAVDTPEEGEAMVRQLKGKPRA